METITTVTSHSRRQSILANEYLTYLKEKKSRSALTLESYHNDLAQFLSFLGGLSDASIKPIDEQVVSLTSQSAQEFVDELIAQKFSVSTIGRRITAVRGFYKYLQGAGRINANPFENVYVPHRDLPQVEFLQPNQLHQLLTAIGDHNWLALRDRAIVALLYNTGMRISELLAVKRDQIDLNKRIVTIHSTGHKSRQCHLQEWVVSTVDRYLNCLVLRDYQVTLAIDDIFINRDGGLLTARSIRRKLKQYSRQASLPIEVGPAILRHSCAMHMLIDGVKVKEVRQQLGHLSASSIRPYQECLQQINAPKERPVEQLAGV